MKIIESSPKLLAEINNKQIAWLEVLEDVKSICNAVKLEGDLAVRRYCQQFDGMGDEEFRISNNEFDLLVENAPINLSATLEMAAQNIRSFADRQRLQPWKDERDNISVGELVRPLDKVGCYVPGGRYPLVSSILMTAIPAKVAGVEEIIVCTPKISSAIALACKIAGVTSLYRVGGAQAIAAMAYGTESIPQVDKIVGPGNKYVTAGKFIASGTVGIDFLAGPSEVVIIADKSANPEYVAADVLAQAEHDPDATAIVITTDMKMAKEIETEVVKQLDTLSTADVARQSLERNGNILLTNSLESAAEIANVLAPEHLELQVSDCELILPLIRNAGAIFCGAYSPEAIGDYASGPNHVLPTGGVCRYRSGLSTRDFQRTPTIQWVSEGACEELSNTVISLARAEGLEAHARSVEKRVKL